jgi:hypothetical protein
MLRMRGEEPREARTTTLAAETCTETNCVHRLPADVLARSLSDIAFVTRRMRCDQMRSRRPEKPEVYSLEYIEDFFWPRTTQMVADRSPQ